MAGGVSQRYPRSRKRDPANRLGGGAVAARRYQEWEANNSSDRWGGEDTEPNRDNLFGGIYDVFAWVNPSEPGYVYLKVFNVETGKRLSEDYVSRDSNELTGWSEDSAMLFFYNSHIWVYEGGFHTHYDARFELWFHPSDGGPERKLVETTRNITGWER